MSNCTHPARLAGLFLLLVSTVLEAQQPKVLANGVDLTTASEATTLNRSTQRLETNLQVRVTNQGEAPIAPPLHVVFDVEAVDGGTLEGLQVEGALGGPDDAPYNAYYFDCSGKSGGDGLGAGESLDLSIRFSRPRNLVLRYDLQLAGVVNRPPVVVDGGPYRGVAVDLAGDEHRYPAHLFKEHFKRVRDAGLQVSVHAGEADGPQSVWSAIRDLGASRIGHGFRAIEDSALVDYLAKHGVGLEICPTSNLHTSTVENYASHPIKALADRGVKFCLNTDDPGISAIDIKHEYEVAAPATGLSREQIHQSQRDGLDMAFLSEEEKTALKGKAAKRAAL